MFLAPCSAPDPALPVPLQQHPAYARAMGREAQAVLVIAAKAPLAYAMLLPGPLGAKTLLRGPVWMADVPQSDRARALDILAPRLIEADSPDPALHSAGFSRVVTPGHIAEWDITGGTQARQARMHGKWRNALRQSQLGPIKITHRPYLGDANHPILGLCAAEAKAKKYKPLPATLAVNLGQGPSKPGRMFTAMLGREAIALMLFFRFGPVVTYHLGWTGPKGRRHNAHHQMLDIAASYFAERGCTRMDLGQVDTQSAPGLARFKIGTGAGIRPLGGSHLRLWPRALATAARGR